MDELREEYGGEDGLLVSAMDDKQKISKKNLQSAVKELGKRNAAKADLEKKAIAQYPRLSIEEIKTVVVEKKWMYSIEQRIRTEMDNISRRLTQRIKELVERYETPLPVQAAEVSELEKRVTAHLEKMGFVL